MYGQVIVNTPMSITTSNALSYHAAKFAILLIFYQYKHRLFPI